MGAYSDFFNRMYITFSPLSSVTNCLYSPMNLHRMSADAPTIPNITKSFISAWRYASVTSDVPNARLSHASIIKVIKSASVDTVGEVVSSLL